MSRPLLANTEGSATLTDDVIDCNPQSGTTVIVEYLIG